MINFASKFTSLVLLLLMKKRLFLLLTLCCFGTLSAQQRIEMNLDEAFKLADENSQQIKISITGYEASQESMRSASSQRLPDAGIEISGSYIGTASVLSRGFSNSGTTTIPYAIGIGEVKNGTQPTPHWGNDFVARVTQVIFAGGGISAGIELAEQGKRMALLNIEKNRQEVRFMLTGSYLNLCKLTNQLEVVEKNIELAEQLLAVMRARHAEGTLLKNDITRYEYQLQTFLLAKTQLTNAIKIVNHDLVTTLHLQDDTEIKPMPLLDVTDIHQKDYWQAKATDNSILLKEAQLGAEMGETKVKAVRSELLPSIAMVIENRLAGPYINDFIPVDANVNAWFIGLGIKYNLGSLWHKNHDLRKAKIDMRQQNEQVNLTRENISKAVHADFVNIETSMEEIDTQRKQMELADEHYRMTQNRYEKGLALLTDMLDASNMKLSTEIDYVNAQINLVYNYYKLKYTTSTL